MNNSLSQQTIRNKNLSYLVQSQSLPSISTNKSIEEPKLDKATLKILKEQEQESLNKSVSFLSPEAIKWMNKRKPSARHSTTAHILPSRAIQLKEIFKGLDFDGSGSIDIHELKEAVEYVANSEAGRGLSQI